MHHTDDARAAWFHLGAALLNENRPDEARSALDRARSEPGATPTNADIGVLRAWAAEESGEPSVALQAYLDAALLDPALAGDILPTAQGLLSTDEATMLVPWLRSTWLPKMQAASSLDIRSLAPFQVRVSLLTGNVGDAVAAVADAVDAGTGTHPVAVADELRAVPDAPCPEAEWRLLIGLALERLGEHADALRFVHEAQQLQLPDEGPLGIAESLVAEADLLSTLAPGSADAPTRRYEAAVMFAARGEHDRAIEVFAESAPHLERNQSCTGIGQTRSAWRTFNGGNWDPPTCTSA